MRRPEENIREAFEYDPETGVLTRRFKGGHRRQAGAKRASGGYIKVGFNGRGVHLGRHPTKEAAAEAYRNFAKVNHGEFYRETSQ